jgi:hypothetical protein
VLKQWGIGNADVLYRYRAKPPENRNTPLTVKRHARASGQSCLSPADRLLK